MFNNLMRILGIMIFLWSITQNIYAQTSDITTTKLKEKAYQQFTGQEYANAYQNYRKLLYQYPKDGLLNYYSGLCLYFQNKDISKSIEYLSYASGKAQVPYDVFYYLGYAYRKNYMFKESKSAFLKYNSVASRQEAKDLMPAREAEMSANAMTYTLDYNPFEIIEGSFISFSDNAALGKVSGKGGVLSKKTEDLLFGDANENDLSSFIFLPREIIRGTTIYFAAYGKSKKRGLELFKVKKLNGKNWGVPVAISDLNTEFDEIMPYYDPISNDLYFASKGYNSIGGFDVFKSHYDEERNIWGEPTSMGFPINSPQNEFLAMPGYDLGTILVITDRQGLDEQYAIYKLKISEPKKSLASASNEELSRIGNFGGISFAPISTDFEKEENLEIEEESTEKETEENNAEIDKVPIKSIEIDTFTQNVNTALSFQSKADSLAQLAKKTRIEVKDMSDPEEIWNIQKKIIEWERLSKEYEEKANQSFVSLDEKQKIAKPEVPGEIQVKEVINDITVYEYSDDVVNLELNKGDTQEQSLDKINTTDLDSKQKPEEVVSTLTNTENPPICFIILDSSPYNSSNPIPLDIKLPEGPFYRIQLGAFGASISPDVFGGLSPLTAESIVGKNLTRYFAGKFNLYSEAANALSKVKNAGFKDAYIVGWYNGEKMSLDRVREFEKRGK